MAEKSNIVVIGAGLGGLSAAQVSGRNTARIVRSFLAGKKA